MGFELLKYSISYHMSNGDSRPLLTSEMLWPNFREFSVWFLSEGESAIMERGVKIFQENQTNLSTTALFTYSL